MLLQEWEADPGVSMVMMKAAGEKAFCAGGDIRGGNWSTRVSSSFENFFYSVFKHVGIYTCTRHTHKYKVNMYRLYNGVHLSHACFLLLFSAVTEAGKVGDDLAKNFFKEEYILNYKIGE